MLGSGKHNRAGTRGALAYLYDARARGIFLQALAIAALCLLFYEIASNTAENLRRQNVASGFDFLGRTSGFDVSQKLISYSNTMTFGRAFWVGLLNTLLVSSLGIVLATGLGFVIGVARLSGNWLVARLSTIYIEIVRNIPLLLQLLFWYFAALKALPMPLQSTELGAGMHLNRRGLYLPWPAEPGAFNAILLGGIVAVGAVFALTSYARRRRKATGEIQSVGWISAAMLIFIPAGFQLLFGGPLAIEFPSSATSTSRAVSSFSRNSVLC